MKGYIVNNKVMDIEDWTEEGIINEKEEKKKLKKIVNGRRNKL